MTLRHILIFETLCEYGSMRKAAEKLYISQPAVSLALAELENNYGILLFDRVKGRLVLNEKGKELRVIAQDVLDDFSRFDEVAKKIAATPVLKIGASLTTGKVFFPILLKEIKNIFPTVKVQLKAGQEKEIEELILNGKIDFGVVGEAHSLDMFYRMPLIEDLFSLVCGKEYPIKDEIFLSELSAYPLLLRERGSASRDYLDQIVEKNHISVNLFLEAQSNEALLGGVKNNLGLAILPNMFIQADLNRNTIREIKTDFLSEKRTFFLIKHKNKNLNKEAKYAWDYLMKIANDIKGK